MAAIYYVIYNRSQETKEIYLKALLNWVRLVVFMGSFWSVKKSMIHKQPFVDDDSYEVAFKHPRHLEHIDQLAPIASLNESHPKTTTSDGDNSLRNCQHIGRSPNGSVVVVSNDTNNFESAASGCFPQFLCINNRILEADNLSFFLEYFDHGHQLGALLQHDDVFSSFDYPFWNPV